MSELTLENYQDFKYDMNNLKHTQFLKNEIYDFKNFLDNLKTLDKMTLASFGVATSLICCGFFGGSIFPLISSSYMGVVTGLFGGNRFGHTTDVYQQKLKEMIRLFQWCMIEGRSVTDCPVVRNLIETIGPFILTQQHLISHDLDSEQINQDFRKICDESTYRRFQKLNKYFEGGNNKATWTQFLCEFDQNDLKFLINAFLYGDYELQNLSNNNGPLGLVNPSPLTMTR